MGDIKFKVGDQVILARPRPDIAQYRGAQGIVTHVTHVDTYLDIEWKSRERPTYCSGMFPDQFDHVAAALMPDVTDYYEAITNG